MLADIRKYKLFEDVPRTLIACKYLVKYHSFSLFLLIFYLFPYTYTHITIPQVRFKKCTTTTKCIFLLLILPLCCHLLYFAGSKFAIKVTMGFSLCAWISPAHFENIYHPHRFIVNILLSYNQPTMSPHTLSEPTIVETSETELISGTESLSDLGAAAVQYKVDAKLSLDDLFAELAEETSTGQTTVKDPEQSEDEFSKIRKAMSKLPKIESSLEAKLEQHDKNTITGKGHDITRINDPIEHIRLSAAEKAKLGEDAGAKWFNMRKPELTAAVKRDLLVIQQRSALDPKRHYKKDKWQIPKFFETGTIIEGNTEFYSRMKRKDRGNTLVEEVLNDQDKGKYFKRKYAEIQEKKTSGKRGHYKKVKEMRKKF